MPDLALNEPLHVVCAGARRTVPAPWDRADALREYLQKEGIGSTVCLEPTDHQAYLEIWPEARTEDVERLLAGWSG